MKLHIMCLLFFFKLVFSFEFQCPSTSQWKNRGRSVCPKVTDYRCLWDINDKRFIQQCEGIEFQMKGYRRVFAGGTTRELCSVDRYQPFMFTTFGNFDCVYKKSNCSEIGQILYDAGSTKTDRKCRCDHKAGYTFLHQPLNYCYCKPTIEDCSCILARCQEDEQLDIDYKCSPKLDWKDSFRCRESSLRSETAGTTPFPLPTEQLFDNENTITNDLSATAAVIYLCLILVICVGDKKHAEKKSNEIKEDTKRSSNPPTNNPEPADLNLDDAEIGSDFLMRCDSETSTTDDTDAEELKQKIGGWKNQVIQFGITGGTAVGKSSFINMLLDYNEESPNRAQTGDGDTTMEPKSYNHPKYDRFTITDMPGYGTANVTKENFQKLGRLLDFDYFLIFIDTVIKEDDIWMAQQLYHNKVPFSIVRPKLDKYVKKQKSYGKSTEEAVLQLRNKVQNTINNNEILKDVRLFLISNKKDKFLEGDLQNLMKDIADRLPNGKAETFLFFLPILTPETIEMKCEELQNRIENVAKLTAITAAIPVPGVDIAANWYIISKELERYLQVLGLDKDYVTSVKGLKHKVFIKTNWKNLFSYGRIINAAKLLTVFGISQLDVLVPFVGSYIAGTVSYELVKSHLESNLKTLKEDAMTVYHYHTNRA